MIKQISFLLCVVLLTSCEKQKGDVTFPNANQKILFQVEYTNYAWGYSHNGFLIDSSGTITLFKYPQSWHNADLKGYISESDMEENIKQLDTISYTIDKSEVLKYFSLLEGILKGELSKPYNRMFDAGETDYSGFLYDQEKKQYKQVLIKRDGDWSIDNNSPDAEAVFHWLQRLPRAKSTNRLKTK